MESKRTPDLGVMIWVRDADIDPTWEAAEFACSIALSSDVFILAVRIFAYQATVNSFISAST